VKRKWTRKEKDPLDQKKNKNKKMKTLLKFEIRVSFEEIC